MDENTFSLDTTKTSKKNFLHKVSTAFYTALLLTGICSLGGITFFIRGIAEQVWTEMGATGFAKQCILYLSLMCIFASLLKIALDEKPFSQTLVNCIRIISVLHLLASIVIPQLPDYTSSGFTLLVFLDGAILLPGLLLFLLSVLLKEGFQMQTELDEIL